MKDYENCGSNMDACRVISSKLEKWKKAVDIAFYVTIALHIVMILLYFFFNVDIILVANISLIILAAIMCRYAYLRNKGMFWEIMVLLVAILPLALRVLLIFIG